MAAAAWQEQEKDGQCKQEIFHGNFHEDVEAKRRLLLST
jgi:hypothetical protein